LDLVEASTFFGRLYDEWFDTKGKKEKDKINYLKKRTEQVCSSLTPAIDSFEFVGERAIESAIYVIHL
jgi:hypothetical protein